MSRRKYCPIEATQESRRIQRLNFVARVTPEAIARFRLVTAHMNHAMTDDDIAGLANVLRQRNDYKPVLLRAVEFTEKEG